MDPMTVARFNVFWFLSIIVPAAIMLAAARSRRRSVLLPTVVASLLLTYVFCNLSVQTKWSIRSVRAQTAEEMEFAQADGANLVFTAFFIGPFEAVFYTTLWGLLGRRIWRPTGSPEPERPTQVAWPRRLGRGALTVIGAGVASLVLSIAIGVILLTLSSILGV